MSYKNEYYELLNDFTLVMKDMYCKVDDFKQRKYDSVMDDAINKAEEIADKIINWNLDDEVLMEKIKIKVIQPLGNIKMLWDNIKKESERKENNE